MGAAIYAIKRSAKWREKPSPTAHSFAARLLDSSPLVRTYSPTVIIAWGGDDER